MTRSPIVFIPVLALILACGNGGGSGACSAGDIEVCTCVDGSRASRVCTDDRVWSPCACREPDATPAVDVRDARPEPAVEAVEPGPEPLADEALPDPGPDAAPEIVAAEIDAEPIPDAAPVDAGPEPFEIHYPDDCAPQCDGRACGPDGCGGTCGACGCGHECQQGACAWIGCLGRECGDSGCPGVSCGGCFAHPNSACTPVFQGSQCTCAPDCSGRQCGDDGCGGSCGTCQVGLCNPNGKCVPSCTPSCADKACGDNGCGGSCGLCVLGKFCSVEGQCVGCLSSADCTPPLACLAMACVPVVP